MVKSVIKDLSSRVKLNGQEGAFMLCVLEFCNLLT